MLVTITIIVSCMIDKCCRHSRLLSHVCVKCVKYRDNERLKRSFIKETNKCIHGNDSSLCEKCLIQNKDQILCVHGTTLNLLSLCNIIFKLI